MRIKRFVAPDMRQALRLIRDELGPEAVILSNGRCEEGIEVTAAVDHDVSPAPRAAAPGSVPFGDASAGRSASGSVAADPRRAARLSVLDEDPEEAAREFEREVFGQVSRPEPATRPEAAAHDLQRAAARRQGASRERQPDAAGLDFQRDFSVRDFQRDSSQRDFQRDSSQRDFQRDSSQRDFQRDSSQRDFQRDSSQRDFQRDSFQSDLAAARRAVRGGQGEAEGTRLDAVSEEVRGLRSLLELQLADLAYGDLARRAPGRATLVRRLGNLGLTRSVSRAVADAVPEGLEPGPAWKAALEVLAAQLRGVPTEVADFQGVVALLGPTGVGKTTTIAKIAARHVLRYGPRSIALITTDSFRVGAHEQLRTFGRIMDIPVRVANDAEELRQSLDQFGDKRLVLIDTAGISQRDVRFAEQVSWLRSGSPLVRVYLVLSAASQWLSLDETLRAFGGSHVDGAMLTKLDESSGLGGVLSVLVRHALPVAYLSDGQRVPEDLEPVDPQRLVARAVAVMNCVDQRLRADGGSALEDRVADGQL